MDKKKLIILLAGLIIIGLFSYLMYRVLFSPPQQPAQPVFQPNETITKKIQLEIDKSIVSPGLSSDNKILYYFTQGDQPGIFKYDLSKRQPELFFSVSDVSDISWSPDMKSAIFLVIQYPERFKVMNSPFYIPDAVEFEQTYWFFDLEKKKITKLSRFVDTYIWTANNKIIFRNYNYEVDPAEDAFYEFDLPTMQSAKIAENPEGGNIKLIFADADSVFYCPTYSESSQSQLMRLDRQTDQSQPFVSDSLSDAIASPLGNYFVATLYNEQNNRNSLMIIDKNTKSLKQFDFPATFTNMIAWSQDEKSVIATVAQGENISNKIYKIDVASGQVAEINYLPPDNLAIKPQSLIVSPDNKLLYFTSENLLYKLDL